MDNNVRVSCNMRKQFLFCTENGDICFDAIEDVNATL